MEDVKCPWCGEDGFDLPGLKMHLMRGWCQPYEDSAWTETRAEAHERLKSNNQNPEKPND